MSESAPTPSSIAAAHGECASSLANALAVFLPGKPKFVWCEPRPRRNRLTNFQPLWRGDASALKQSLDEKDLIGEEARLFWETCMLHLVAAGGKTRWAAFWEGAAQNIPDWLKSCTEVRAQATVNAILAHSETLKLTPAKSESEVLTLRDFQRYGLPRPAVGAFPQKIKVIEYRFGVQLVFWTLKEA